MAKYNFRNELSGFYETFGKGVDKSGKLERLTTLALQKGKSYTSRHSDLMKEIRKTRFTDKEEEYVENLMHTLEGYISNQKKEAIHSAKPIESQLPIASSASQPIRYSITDRIREFSSELVTAFRGYDPFQGVRKYAYVGLLALTACGLHSDNTNNQSESNSANPIIRIQKESVDKTVAPWNNSDLAKARKTFEEYKKYFDAEFAKKENSQKPAPAKPAPVDSYEQRRLHEAQLVTAKTRALEKSYALYLAGKERAINQAGKERAINQAGIPYTGTDDVKDYKPGQFHPIQVDKIQLGKKAQRGALEHYADYSSSPGIGSTDPEEDMALSGKHFKKSGQNLVDTLTASSFNANREKLGYPRAANGFVKYSTNWGKSIADPFNPDSKAYKGKGIPARAIAVPGALIGGALDLPFEILSLASGNSSRRVVNPALAIPGEFAEGFGQALTAPGNTVPNRGAGYHFRRAYTGTLRFLTNVFTGKGFSNPLNAEESFNAKGPIASLETGVNVASTALSALADSGAGLDVINVVNPAAPIGPAPAPAASSSGGRYGRISGK